MKIVMPYKISISSKHLNEIRKLGDLTVYNTVPNDEDEVISRIKDANILITTITVKLIPRMLEAAKKLRYIIIPATGYHQYFYEGKVPTKGIKVLNCPTFSSDAVTGLTLAFILSLTRKVKSANRSLEEGRWNRVRHEGIELKGKTLGLIGYGNIGKKVAIAATLLGMKVVHSNSKTNPNQTDKIIRESDIVSLHLPLNEKTKGIMNRRRIRMMKKGAFLINVSRGGLIDQPALVQALKSGHLAGAGLDVYINEPTKEANSGVPKEIVALAKMDNVIATPHIAFNTEESLYNMGEEIIANVKSCIKGKPINVVN